MKMLKKRSIAILAFMCALLVMLAACGGNEAPPASDAPPPPSNDAPVATPEPTVEPKIFKFAFPMPAESVDGRAYAYLSEVVAEMTNGSVIIETYPADTLIPTAEVIDALMSGEIHMAHNSVSFFSPTVKELTPLEVPGSYRSDRYLELPLLMDEVDSLFQQYGLKWFSCAGAANYMTFTSSKNLVVKPEDMVGMNVRVSGKWTGEAVKLWGGTPVTLPTGEVTTALERGTIDAVYCGDLTVCMPFKLYEMAPYITMTTLQEQWGGAIITLTAWNSLTPEEQAAMEKASELVMMFYEEARLENGAVFEDAAKEAGCEIYYLTDEENQAFKDMSLTLMPEALETGGANSSGLADLLEKFRVLQSTTDYVPYEFASW